MAPQGNVQRIITKPHKGTKMADPILKSSIKTRLNTIYCDIFSFKIKKADKFQVCLKQLQVCFPLAAGHSSFFIVDTIFYQV
jgi:hypothetical protein